MTSLFLNRPLISPRDCVAKVICLAAVKAGEGSQVGGEIINRCPCTGDMHPCLALSHLRYYWRFMDNASDQEKVSITFNLSGLVLAVGYDFAAFYFYFFPKYHSKTRL